MARARTSWECIRLEVDWTQRLEEERIEVPVVLMSVNCVVFWSTPEE